MTNLPLANIFLILSLVFLIIAVVGKSKFAFIEINPGGAGRFLALLLGILSLIGSGFLIIFPTEKIALIKAYFAEQIQQNLDFFTQFTLPS